MALEYIPTTELEAVNTMLNAIGEMPVNTIPASGVSDAVICQQILHRVNRQVQGKGLKCNSEYKYSLTPDGNGKLNVPVNTLRIEPYYRTDDLAQRGLFIYDRYDKTFVFTQTKYFDIVFFLPFTDLPEEVRAYICIKAARRFQANTVGSPTLHEFTEVDEWEAKAEMERWQLNKTDDTILESSFIYNIVNRRA